MKLTTLEELKENLGITTSDDDVILNKLISRVSLIIENYIGYALDGRILTEYHNGGDNTIFASHPIIDEDTIKVSNKITGYEFKIDCVIGRSIYLKEQLPEGVNIIKLEYRTGYSQESEVPYDIAGVAEDWIRDCYYTYKEQDGTGTQNLKVKSRKIDSLSVSYFSSAESKYQLAIDNFETLDRYKLKDII